MKTNLKTTMMILLLAAALAVTACDSGSAQGSQAAVESAAADTQSEEDPDAVSQATEEGHGKKGSRPEGGTPPEKPSGEGKDRPDGTLPDGETPPETPSGEEGKQGGKSGDKSGKSQNKDRSGDSKSGDKSKDGKKSGRPGDKGSSKSIDYTAANTFTEDAQISGKSLTSTGTDENAVLVKDGTAVTLSDVKITRTSSDSSGGDDASFYGVGAAVLTTKGTTYISGSKITTDASGGAGVFSYGDGITYVADTDISTAQGASGGIHVAGGGKLYAWDLTVETEGRSSAAIRSDRGSGTMAVDGGSYTSSGSGSPAIYSTADITVHDAELTATGSEAICIEGLNSIRLFDCDLTGNMPDDKQNDCTWNVILYQSMSGDSQVGNSTFEMVGGSLTAKNGGMFYTTNTESTFILKDVDISYADQNDFFLKVTGNSNARGWGSSGKNGADCTFTAISQDMEGDVIWDSISTLKLYLTEGSVLTGAIVDDESNAGAGGDGSCAVIIDAGSKWIVTGDSTVSELQCAGTIVDAKGKTVSIVGTDGTVHVKGNSSYTVTVGSYSAKADVSGASAADSWESFQVEKPAQLG